MPRWDELAVAVAVGLIVFFDWVPTPLNRNIRVAAVRDRLIGDLVHGPIGVLVVIAIQQRWRWVVLVLGIVNWWDRG